MAESMKRIGVVGAATLAGKELLDALEDSQLAAAEFVLLDEEDAAGQMTAAGDEVVFVQRLEPGAFERLDYVFFAGDKAQAKQYAEHARKAGASIIDLTGALEGQPGVLVVGCATSGPDDAVPASVAPDLKTTAVVPAHPAALMLATLAHRLAARAGLRQIAATVFEPASQHGQRAMDELHQQTVTLLSFQDVPKQQYDAQVSFNLLPGLGSEARIPFDETAQRIRAHYAVLTGGATPALSLQLVQAPVFHGYTASIVVDLAEPLTVAELEGRLAGEPLEIVTESNGTPNNLGTAGQAEIQVKVLADDAGGPATRLWLWVAADNLKLAAGAAIHGALELQRLRPSGSVQ
ncbi:MAG: segregation protein B [Acidobacteriota bacterium]|nr:segregation protein B [Acidobacteriota bacterium]